MKVTITLPDPGLRAAAGRARRRVDRDLPELLERIGERGATIARGVAPAQSGHFRDTIDHTVDTDAVSVGSSSRRAHLVESGRRPGKMPPPDLLADLFAVPDREAFLIARAIGRSGTDGAKVFEFTRKAMQSEVRQLLREHTEAVVPLDRRG